MRNKGFTLIETLVVGGIILILVFGAIAVISGGGKNNVSVSTTAVSYPEATGYVVDQAEILSPETEAKLTNELKALDNKAQVAVVTIKSTEPLTIEEYSIKLAEKWKPGYKGKDNGIIFIVAVDDRKVRIEVGRGLEGQINDSKAGQMLDESVIPFLKDNKWEEGILSGVARIGKEVEK